jgi:hypothetical protein
MRFSDEHKAKQFFIDKIAQQAEKSGVSLTEAEKQMLIGMPVKR